MARTLTTPWLETYLEYTRYQESPGKYHLWVGLLLLASALARRVYLDRGYFRLYPNLYVGLVGPTGMGKSAAAEIGVDNMYDALKRVEVMRGKVTSWYLYDWMGRTTVDGKPAVATILSSELKTLLGDVNKVELVALLTDLYGCPEAREYRTKTHDVVMLNKVYLNLLACSTPEWLTLGITEQDISGGFTGRFVYVCEDTTERSFPFPEDFYNAYGVSENKEVLLKDLEHIGELEGTFMFSDEAKAKYTCWYSGRKRLEDDERLGGYYARKRDHIIKVAMLLSVSESDSLIMTEDHLTTAFQVLKAAEQKMVMAFRGVVSEPALKYRELVLEQVQKAGSITRAELLRRNSSRLDKETLMRVLDSLKAEERVEVSSVGTDASGRVQVLVKATD